MQQTITSAATSVNSTKLPALYSHINTVALLKDWLNDPKNGSLTKDNRPAILDIGCGKYTSHLDDFWASRGFKFYGYDKYHKSSPGWQDCEPIMIICSNVLNVINPDAIQLDLHKNIQNYHKPYAISIYQGTCKGIGKKTSKGYQANQKLGYYKFYNETIKKGVITLPEYTKYIK